MAGKRQTIQLYRNSEIGTTLVDTLDELMTTHNMPKELSYKVLEQFDAVRILRFPLPHSLTAFF